MDNPGDVFEDVSADAAEELERDPTYEKGDPDNVVDLAAGQGSEADRLHGDDGLPADAAPEDVLAEPEERDIGEPEAAPAPTSAPTPAPEPAPAPAPAPAAEPAEAPQAAPEQPAQAPAPKADSSENGKAKSRPYLVWLYNAEQPTVMHLQMKEDEDGNLRPLLIEASNWDRAMKLAYRQFAPDGGAIGIAVCPERNFRHHMVSEKPRPVESTGIHFE